MLKINNLKTVEMDSSMHALQSLDCALKMYLTIGFVY